MIHPKLTALTLTAAIASSFSLCAQSILNETWADGDRTNQSLPSSATWYSSQVTANLTAQPGSMTQQLGGTTGMVLAYFTGAFNSTIDLAVGETLQLNYGLSFTGLGATTNFLRIGLYNTVADPRVSADGTGVTNSAFFGATGYMVNTVNGLGATATADLRRRTGGASPSGNLMTAGNQYVTMAPTGSFAAAVANDTIYNGLIQVTRADANTVTLLATLTHPDEGLVYSVSASDAVSNYSQFNTFAIASSGSNGNSFTLHSVDIGVIPEPSTYALIFGSGALIFGLIRRGGIPNGVRPKASIKIGGE